MIDFRRWHPAQAYTMFATKKVSERNENCRFQPVYVRKAMARKVVRSERLGGDSTYPHLTTYNHYGYVSILPSTETELKTATDSLGYWLDWTWKVFYLSI
jgi:hypothetical protein